MPDQSLFSTEGYALIQAIIDTGYLWQTIGVACAFVGIFYVINRFVTLATMVLIPISINVVLFQIFLQPNPLTVSAAPAYIFLACNLFILWINKDDFVYIAAG